MLGTQMTPFFAYKLQFISITGYYTTKQKWYMNAST